MDENFALDLYVSIWAQFIPVDTDDQIEELLDVLFSWHLKDRKDYAFNWSYDC